MKLRIMSLEGSAGFLYGLLCQDGCDVLTFVLPQIAVGNDIVVVAIVEDGISVVHRLISFQIGRDSSSCTIRSEG